MSVFAVAPVQGSTETHEGVLCSALSCNFQLGYLAFYDFCLSELCCCRVGNHFTFKSVMS